MKAALAESFLPRVKADAQLPLARAPISQPCTELPPTAQQLSGSAQSFQDEDATAAADDLARRQQEWAKEKAAGMKTKKEKEEQWRQSMEDRVFKKRKLADSSQLTISRLLWTETRDDRRKGMRSHWDMQNRIREFT